MKIANDRPCFYQWELNQQLELDIDCGEVHFENGTLSDGLAVEVKEENGVRVCDVPNILLQTAAPLRAFAWDSEKTYVIAYAAFNVLPKEKPSDYAYTETEVRTVNKAVKQALKAAEDALASAKNAGNAANLATQATENADKATLAANQAATDANSSAQRAGNAADLATQATENADKATLAANQAAADARKAANEVARIDDSVVGTAAWSSKNIVDRLCPTFSKSGVVVVCEPVKDYPLEVVTDENATTITVCGKNLWNLKTGVSVVNYTTSEGVYTERYGYRVKLPAGTYTAHAELVNDLGSSYKYIYCYIVKDNGNMVRTAYLVANKEIYTQTITLKEDECFLVCHGYSITATSESQANKLFNQGWNIQIEAGAVSTPYEEYNGGTFAVGEEIAAKSGINYLYADSGEITVTGRADPVAIIEKLTNAVLALGSNV